MAYSEQNFKFLTLLFQIRRSCLHLTMNLKKAYTKKPMQIRVKMSLENSYSTRQPPFAINFRNFLFQMIIHILNSKTTQKHLFGVFVLKVIFIDDHFITS